jgi:MinD superfamily P-loop ATPase
MKLAVASGKGGTGKTTLAVNLAAFLARPPHSRDDVCLLDCDVEEPNAHLFVHPDLAEERPVLVLRPDWLQDKCTACGACARECRYNALAVAGGRVLFFPELCHACGVCAYVCPSGAMPEHEVPVGRVQAGTSPLGFRFAHGLLNLGESLAPRVVLAVKNEAPDAGLTIIDAAPGTACPVVAAVTGCDVAILVTEPTPFGLNDLELAAGLTLQMGIPTGIVVNRSDGDDALIVDYARRAGIPAFGRIPFRRAYAETCARGGLLIDEHPEVCGMLAGIWERARRLCGAEAPPAPPAERPPATAAESMPPVSGAVGRAREMVVLSGKGGTGKTTITASLAALLDGKVLCDCDVDAADLHLLLRPELREARDFPGGLKARIDPALCTRCGLCAGLCRFGAITPGEHDAYAVDPRACEGCGLCGLACPAGAVRFEEVISGQSYVSATEYGYLSHARLGIGEENSGRLVTRVRNRAQELLGQTGADAIIADGSPGTGCPVIASMSGVDLALIVTEPTVSGVHDLTRVLDLARHFAVRSLVCTNKCDLNADQAERIRRIAREREAAVIGEVPFDPQVNESLMAGEIVVMRSAGPAAAAIRALAERVEGELRRHGSTDGAGRARAR